jgi:hypothetical protein
MEGLLAYEDTATIIASIYVEQEQSEKNFKKVAKDRSTRNQTCLADLSVYFIVCLCHHQRAAGSSRLKPTESGSRFNL